MQEGSVYLTLSAGIGLGDFETIDVMWPSGAPILEHGIVCVCYGVE
jgi:hypothetical protein